MSIVNIRNIELVNNPARFEDEYHFRIKFEAIAPLEEDLEWRLIYVGSAKSEEYDQELDSCMVGPIPAGINAFDFTAPAPARNLLPSDLDEDILGVTVIIITASYRDKEFVRVGYYVNTYYPDEVEQPPEAEGEEGTERKREARPVEWERLWRNVLIEKPKVTRFQNPWDSNVQPTGFDQQISQGYDGGADSYMLDNAPLPPPVTKAAPTGGYSGMEVDGDQPMTA